MSADEVLSGLVTSEADIVFTDPSETARDSANRLSLWLYRVTESESLKNQPTLRGGRERPGEERRPPLGLDLYYLLTPVGSPESDLPVLGKSMQILYDNSVLLVGDEEDSRFEELRIIFCQLSLEELTRVWEALREPYRLSVCYLVRVTSIDSQRLPAGARIFERAAPDGGSPRERERSEL